MKLSRTYEYQKSLKHICEIEFMDTDINNYSVEELTEILQLKYPAKSTEIIKKTNEYIKKYNKKGDDTMAAFFQDIQNKLIDDNDNRQVQKEELAKNVYNVPLQKDVLNPLLTNITTRIVNIDSQFRDYTFEDSLFQTSVASYSHNEYSSSYYNANLCEPLTDVLSITMENIIVPKTWYAIDSVYNNNFFWITNKEDFLIVLQPGNYTASEFVAEMNTRLKEAGFSKADQTFCKIDPTSGKFTFLFQGVIDPNGIPLAFLPNDGSSFGITDEAALLYMIETYAYFTFFDFGNIKYYKYVETHDVNPYVNLCFLPQSSIDSTLGWLMGFRAPYLFIKESNTATVNINLSGTQYFLLMLADYQTNRVSSDIITVTGMQDSHIDVPQYINTSLLYRCIKRKYEIIINSEKSIEDLLFKSTARANQLVPQFIPSAPRILTQSQMYTTNQIIQHNRDKSMNYRLAPPSTNDVLALIPVNLQGIDNQNLFIQDKLQSNRRVFFGPVDIDRFTVRLLNDKGQLVNLNGGDWSFTLKVELLYQI